MNFFTELSRRWDKSGPVFFQKIKSLGLWLSATGAALVTVPAAFNALMDSLNVQLDKEFDLSLLAIIASYMILSGLIIAAVANLPVKDTESLKK